MISKNEVKYIRSLGQQKGSSDVRSFLAEGAKIVIEMMQTCPSHIEKIYATLPFIESNMHLMGEVSFVEVDQDMLSRLSQMKAPNQALAVMKKFFFSAPPYDSKEWILLLDGIQDPGNMGTIIREADWFGIRHILCTNDCVDPYNRKVVQASMGSLSRVGVHIVELSDWIQHYKGPVIGTMLDGQYLNDFSFPSYGIIVIGREGSGIRPEANDFITQTISIPSFGNAESLNAAVATGIVLWEIRRWRR
jgi:TrmH family RNA methyltransferase